MVRRHPFDLPQVWLVSDERAVEDVVVQAAQLPPGSGIIVRHDGLDAGERWRLVRRLVRTARARGLVVFVAGSVSLARRWGADGVHVRSPSPDQSRQAGAHAMPMSAPVHSPREARRSMQCGIDIVFISPLHETRSHPGAPGLGKRAWLRLARLARPAAAIALGGMTLSRAQALRRASDKVRGKPGWAAIDHWDKRAERRRQKRKAVPT